MTDHPITPPPELVEQWRKSGPADAAVNNAYEQHIATQAAQWGADQELEACCEWLQDPDLNVDTYKLRAARRPKPLSWRVPMADLERDAARYRWIKAAPRLRIDRMPDSHFWTSAETGERYKVTHSLAAFDTGFSGLPTLDDLVDQAMEMYPIPSAND